MNAHPHLLRLPAVVAATGLPKSTLYFYVRAGRFPAPVRIGARAVAWPAAAVWRLAELYLRWCGYSPAHVAPEKSGETGALPEPVTACTLSRA